MAVERHRLYTIEEFEEFLAQTENKDRLFELVNGEIVEKVPTERHGVIVVNISTELRLYIRRLGKGRVAIEVRHQAPDDRYNDRLPDISYFVDSSRPMVEQGAVPQMPDLAVEVKSPSDTYTELRDKAHYYLAHGTQLVWLVYPEKQMVEVLTADDFTFVTVGQQLDGGDLLPGFTMKVEDIFAG